LRTRYVPLTGGAVECRRLVASQTGRLRGLRTGYIPLTGGAVEGSRLIAGQSSWCSGLSTVQVPLAGGGVERSRLVACSGRLHRLSACNLPLAGGGVECGCFVTGKPGGSSGWRVDGQVENISITSDDSGVASALRVRLSVGTPGVAAAG
jgi:hypothetical protein